MLLGTPAGNGNDADDGGGDDDDDEEAGQWMPETAVRRSQGSPPGSPLPSPELQQLDMGIDAARQRLAASATAVSAAEAATRRFSPLLARRSRAGSTQHQQHGQPSTMLLPSTGARREGASMLGHSLVRSSSNVRSSDVAQRLQARQERRADRAAAAALAQQAMPNAPAGGTTARGTGDFLIQQQEGTPSGGVPLSMLGFASPANRWSSAGGGGGGGVGEMMVP